MIRTGTFDERERLILIGSCELQQRGAKVLPDCVWMLLAPTLESVVESIHHILLLEALGVRQIDEEDPTQ